MAEVQDRALDLEGRGEHADIDEDLGEAQEEADGDDRLDGTDAAPTASRAIAQMRATTTTCAAIPLMIWPIVERMRLRRAAAP